MLCGSWGVPALWQAGAVVRAERALPWPPRWGDAARGAWGVLRGQRRLGRLHREQGQERGQQVGGDWKRTLRVFSPAGQRCQK
ncbi:hypothetical protein ASE52_22720 [Acidovorax sp. Root275]|nr:hypothetical protein ASE52_22720 [Acidovorax sp. Root275]